MRAGVIQIPRLLRHSNWRLSLGALLIATLLLVAALHTQAAPVKIEVDKLQLRASNPGSCDQVDTVTIDSGNARDVAWTEAASLWQLEVTSPWPADTRPVISLGSPFYFEAAVKFPRTLAWQWHQPTGETDASWPAGLAVFPAWQGLKAGDVITLCLSAKVPFVAKAQVLSETDLRRSTIAGIRAASLSEGTLAAMTLAAIGLSLVMQRLTFVMFAGGMGMALMFVLVSNGTLLDLPGGVWLARDWPAQRIAGISATMLIGWGLARFIEYEQRHPVLWRVFLALMGIMGVLLVLAAAPTPARYMSLSPQSNALMVMMIVMLLTSAVQGLLQRHRASIVFLASWSPVLIVTAWMGTTANSESAWLTTSRWLYPITLVYACSFLFTELAKRLSATQAERDLARLRAKTDHLTGVMTRDELYRRMSLLQAMATSGRGSFAVLFVDFDHFKTVNDTYGHATGDAALIAATQRIMSALRSKDSVGRYGGEEFVILLEGIDATKTREIAERIRTDIENGGQPIEEGLPPLTVSIGIASFEPDAQDSVAAVMERADSALYAAKQAGRNQVMAAAETPAGAAPTA